MDAFIGTHLAWSNNLHMEGDTILDYKRETRKISFLAFKFF